MRSIIFATAAMAALSTANATTLGQFDGTAHFTSTTCSGTSSWNMNFFYFPPNIGSNGAATGITLRWPFSVNALDLRNYMLASGTLNGNAFVTTLGTRVYYKSAYTWSPAVRITSQNPATITAATHKVTLAGDVKSFDGPGCDAHFDATLYSYPIP